MKSARQRIMMRGGFHSGWRLYLWVQKRFWMAEISKSFFYFILAGLCEIGGGYLVWLWLREDKGRLYFIAGSAILIVYGIVPPCNLPVSDGPMRRTAVSSSSFPYSGDGKSIRPTPDRFDLIGLIGGLTSLVGVLIIMYWPRKSL